MVVASKNSGFLNDELVGAVVAMLNSWQPNPKPEWVTCFHSDRNVIVVPDFADRLASNFGIPFFPAIEEVKAKAKESQKLQQNIMH